MLTHKMLCVVSQYSMCFLSGMNQFNQMGMQSMGQRSTPPLPMGATGNQVSSELTICQTFYTLTQWN